MKKGEFLIYNDGNNNIKVEVFFQDENIWATQKQMANLFGVQIPAISKHLNNIFEENELEQKRVISILETTADDGKKYNTNFYNLDAIISVGYRVNSTKATQFRIWATKVLKEYVIKGFVMDDEKLKSPNKNFGKDYFQELLERVRSIRSSERRIYQKITDIFAECSIDYDKNSQITKDFYASVQNKFHYAITNKTAAEIIYDNANSKEDNMGLTTWKNSPNGRILKSDTIVAKNYLKEKEIKQLERTISSFFDYIERIIENHKLMKMEDLANSVDKFLSFNEFKVLENKGKISQKEAEEKAHLEYETFNKTQKIESDFDKMVEERKLK